jgi:hypothetical protein
MNGKFLDRTYLIIAGIAILAGLLGLLFFLEDVLLLTQGWVIFILFSIGYLVIVTKFSLPILRRSKEKVRDVILLSVLQIIVLLVMFLIYYTHLLVLPENGLLFWGVVLGVAGTITVQLFAALVGKINRKGRRHY